MHTPAALAALGLAAAGIMAAAPPAAAAAPVPPEGPGFLIISQATAKCVGLPDSTALKRGVPGLALVRTRQLPVPASADKVDECLKQAAQAPNNPLKDLVGKFGALLGMKPQPPQPKLPNSPAAGTRTTATATATATAPTDDEPPLLGLVDPALNKACIGIPIEKVQNVAALVDVGVARAMITSSPVQRCLETAPVSSEEPLARIIDKLPTLS
ncbi:hypothetical protein [Streptomyces sp. PA5.6]|uniref:hypothetical protein n=1 Tax=Streptomyces sp. PA5.6 TaxID=3035651 RepID=UPI0039046B4A